MRGHFKMSFGSVLVTDIRITLARISVVVSFWPREITTHVHQILRWMRDTQPSSERLKESFSPIQTPLSSNSWKIRYKVSCKYPYL